MSRARHTKNNNKNGNSSTGRRRRRRGGDRDASRNDDDEDGAADHFLVSCRCESAKLLSTLLSCLDNISGSSSFVMDETKQSRRRKALSSTLQPVTVYVTGKSLSFHVYGKAQQIQSSVDMPASMFMEYHVDSTTNTTTATNQGAAMTTPEDWQAGGEFCVNLSTVLECLQMLGTHHMERTKVAFSYNTTAALFKLELIDAFSTFAAAAIPGMISPDAGHDDDDDNDDGGNASLPLAFRSSPITARIILKSYTLSVVMSELDYVAGATRATVSVSRSTGLRISTVGHATGNRCTIIVPVVGRHVVSAELPSTRDTVTVTTNDYPLQVLKDAMRGLDIADETCITMNKAGMVAIQHVVYDKTISEDACYVDCILCSLVDENEEDDDSDDDEEEEEEDAAMTPPEKVPSPQSVAAVSTRSLDGHNSSSSKNKKSKVTQTEDDDDNAADDDDDDDPDNNPEEQQGALLFGSVLGGGGGSVSNASISRSRTSSSHRRRTRRQQRQAAADHDDSDDGSKNMLLDDDNDKYSDNDDDDDDDASSKELGVLSRAAKKNQRAGAGTTDRSTRQDECPSPELLYGHQHR